MRSPTLPDSSTSFLFSASHSLKMLTTGVLCQPNIEHRLRVSFCWATHDGTAAAAVGELEGGKNFPAYLPSLQGL